MAKSRSLNKVLLIGNLTRDPSLRETAGGVLICSFGIATNTSWKDKDGSIRERAEYHNLVAFNKLAEICAQVLAVGMLIYVEGEIRNKVIEGEDDRRHYRTEIKLNDMILIDSKGKKGVGFDAAKAPETRPALDGQVERNDQVEAQVQNDDPSSEELNGSDLF